MRRFFNMVLRSLVSASKGRPWLQKRVRVQGKDDQKATKVKVWWAYKNRDRRVVA